MRATLPRAGSAIFRASSRRTCVRRTARKCGASGWTAPEPAQPRPVGPAV